MSALICETVMATTMAGMRAARDASAADMVELRLDSVEDLDVAGALADRRRPVIVTCRSAAEGGKFQGAEEARLRILAAAIQLGAEYVDVEWRADRRSLPWSKSTKIVLSHHDFSGVPADLADRVRAMRAEIADVVKISVAATRLRDCLTLQEATRGGGRQVAIAMGAAGLHSRVHPSFYGSVWTYAGTAAPGQVSVRALADCYRVGATSPSTALYAIAGAPLGHSASPAMHNAAFQALGIDALFVPLESADAADFDATARALGVAGASVTAPLKEALFKIANTHDADASAIGAVNTLRRAPVGWDARNFDAAAFLAPMARRGWTLRGQKAVVLGAGGAARTAAWVLNGCGADVAVAARQAERAAALARDLNVTTAPFPPGPGWQLLVNATPVGTRPRHHESPMPSGLVSGPRVYDLVYNPPTTALLRDAQAAGAEGLGGLEMLVAQAAKQFEWWTGRAAPVEAMQHAAVTFLDESESTS